MSEYSLKKYLQTGDTKALPPDVLELNTVYDYHEEVLHGVAAIAFNTMWRFLSPQTKRVGEIGL